MYGNVWETSRTLPYMYCACSVSSEYITLFGCTPIIVWTDHRPLFRRTTMPPVTFFGRTTTLNFLQAAASRNPFALLTWHMERTSMVESSRAWSTAMLALENETCFFFILVAVVRFFFCVFFVVASACLTHRCWSLCESFDFWYLFVFLLVSVLFLAWRSKHCFFTYGFSGAKKTRTLCYFKTIAAGALSLVNT